MEWVIDENLARSSRPEYRGECGKPVHQVDVDIWIKDVKRVGIRSIICLLDDEHLRLYMEVSSGLIAYFKENGFVVSHIPVQDHQYPPPTSEDLLQVEHAYRSLPKPILIHCSAGIDRTGSAVKHLCRLYSKSMNKCLRNKINTQHGISIQAIC